MAEAERVFLLSPARANGQRASYLLNERAAFPLALRVRAGGATVGEVFSFLSGLYVRGKLTYARHFAGLREPEEGATPARRERPAGGPAKRGRGRLVSRVLVITSDRGLVPPDAPVTLEDLRRWSTVEIDAANPVYREPLARDARSLAGALGPAGEAVLLGSVATGKYVDVFLDALGPRLTFPAEFVGRGDMSRGGLLLRAAVAGEELAYVPVAGAVRKGARPPKLDPKTRPRR